MSNRLSGLVCALALLAACGTEKPDDSDYQHVMAFDTARVRLVSGRDTLNLHLELAVSALQKSMGLMERSGLADGAGMLFVYDSTQAADAGFWMFRTRIPLDIAFFDSAGVLRAVRAMAPCPSPVAQGCPTYTPDVPYQVALEMKGGAFAQRGIDVGDSLLLGDLPDSVRRAVPASAQRP